MGGIGIELIVTEVDLGSDSSDPSSIRINDTAADGDTLGQAELESCQSAERANVLACTGIRAILRDLWISNN
jgi:hypothetical protein